MNNKTLVEYVAGRLRTGITRVTLEEELRTVGWSEEEVEDAYRSGLIDCGLPIPDEKNRAVLSRTSSTVDIVINFFSFILLGIVATALGILLFGVVNKFFPDVLDTVNMYTEASTSSAIHYAIAALIIGFPLYYFSIRLWFRTFREDEGRTESKLSQWLTYLVLLITAVTIVGDLITVVFTLLQGEITVRFFLKALVILMIAGIVFGFYYLERRKVQYHVDIPRTLFLVFGRIVTGILLLSIALGFFASGSPTTERQRTFDRTRSEHLETLSDCVTNYAKTFGKLPVSLDDIRYTSELNYCGNSMQDPETALLYEYRVITPSTEEGLMRVGEFELCATFALDFMVSTDLIRVGNEWAVHPAGRSCDIRKTQLSVPEGSIQKSVDEVPLDFIR